MSRLCIAVAAVLVCCASAQMLSGKMFGAAMTEGAEIMPGKNMTSMLAADCVSRDAIMARAKQWSDAKVPYCQCNNDCCGTCPYCNSYRCDCSGFVSFTWNLGRGYTTATITDVASYISASDLVRGDALVCSSSKGGHIVLFDSWITKGSKYNCYQEPGCSTHPNYCYYGTCDANWVWSECGSFKPIRFKNVCPPGPPPPPPPPAVPSPPSNCTTFHSGLCPGSSDCQCTMGDGCSLNAEHAQKDLAERIKQHKLLKGENAPYTCSSLGGKCHNVLHGKCPGPSTCMAIGDSC